MREEEELRTVDFWLAAFLLAKGAGLVCLEKNPDRPAQTVVVLKGQDLKENAQAYTVNGQVGILSFKQIFLNLKHSLFDKNQNTTITNGAQKGLINEPKRIIKA